ncbi:hypothetical protein QT237_09090 [Geobacillus stearothermophilus]|nr:hypothetical protein QT237_09090 [Geobacillus stearothermophilus]
MNHSGTLHVILFAFQLGRRKGQAQPLSNDQEGETDAENDCGETHTARAQARNGAKTKLATTLDFFWYDTTNMDDPASHHRALLYTYNGFPGGEELSSQICPLHAYAAKALIHDGCRCFFAFRLTIKRLLFIETKPNITSYNLYYVD